MAYTKAHASPRTGSLKLAQQRYKQTHKDKLNEKNRQTYDPVKNKAKKLLTPLGLK